MVVSSSPASHSEKELEEELIDYGIRLIAHPSDELLSILDKVETLLVRVAQAPPETMKLALHPIMKALIGSELLSHSDEGIIVSVALCLSEIMRITAPQQPYDDAVMKQIFQHIVETFEKLSNMKSHCYSKSVQIIENVSKVRACVMLLDLECDTLVIDMFKLFLRIIRFSHTIDVFKNMEDIMIWIIKECDEVSRELLMSLLDSIKNKNQKASFASWKLGRNVLKTCSSIVRPYVVEAVKSMSLDISRYDVILASICHETTNGESLIENENTPLTESPVAIMESQQEATPKPVDTSNGNFKSESRSKTRLNWDQTEHLKDTESPTDLQHHSLEGTQPGTNLSRRPRRRVQKSLRKHDNNYVHFLGESSFLSEDGKQIMPHMLFPVNKSVTTPSKGIGNADKNFRKMGMPKKNQVELSSEKGFQGSTTKAKPMRGSIKKEPFVHNNAENYLGTDIVIHYYHSQVNGNKNYFELPHEMKEQEYYFVAFVKMLFQGSHPCYQKMGSRQRLLCSPLKLKALLNQLLLHQKIVEMLLENLGKWGGQGKIRWIYLQKKDMKGLLPRQKLRGAQDKKSQLSGMTMKTLLAETL
ncbi:unnamed protein product [Cuscuta campestris]|uniref:Uncharacterized protein n=1 Tax=Cuscuta campestris TaxID=132261 RepID=A0A484LIF3_9ASTE|nr:unnamed protein product [Cuscuta campestris]